jgi:hypothetical protein
MCSYLPSANPHGAAEVSCDHVSPSAVAQTSFIAPYFVSPPVMYATPSWVMAAWPARADHGGSAFAVQSAAVAPSASWTSR